MSNFPVTTSQEKAQRNDESTRFSWLSLSLFVEKPVTNGETKKFGEGNTSSCGRGEKSRFRQSGLAKEIGGDFGDSQSERQAECSESTRTYLSSLIFW
jgi:hypothetical protein